MFRWTIQQIPVPGYGSTSSHYICHQDCCELSGTLLDDATHSALLKGMDDPAYKKLVKDLTQSMERRNTLLIKRSSS